MAMVGVEDSSIQRTQSKSVDLVTMKALSPYQYQCRFTCRVAQ